MVSTPPAMSPHIKQYFDSIKKEVERVYKIAIIARSKGLDPSTEVESPPANDMADRVEQLVGPKGLSARIHELQAAGKDQNDITFQVATEILDGKFGVFPRADAIERAIRAALAIKTEGVVSAPLEGISKVITRDDGQGGEYLSIYFAGPIRAAGGTTAAFAVLITDFVRAHLKIPQFKASEREADRLVEEVKLYDRIMNLQYPSTNEEIRECYLNVPVEINGEATEDREVSAYRDVPRIETNVVRGGACLVLNDGLLAKASKLLKIIKEKNIPGWEWLKQLKEKVAQHHEQAAEAEKEAKEGEYGGGLYDGQKEVVAEKKPEKTEDILLERRKKLFEKYPPLSKYIADVIAGRPVFAYPSRIGGYRLRYGRSRNSGLAACGLHPASMAIVDDFCAIGTQTRIERPGKSSSTMPVDSIEGPIVLMQNGSVRQITSPDDAHEIYPNVERILFLGDILLGFGEFVENNQKLAPSGYVEEWWIHHLRSAIEKRSETEWGGVSYTSDFIKQINTAKNYFSVIPTAAQAIEMCTRLGIPLHPKHLDFWGNLEPEEIIELRKFLLQGEQSKEMHLANNPRLKWLLEVAFVPHEVLGESIILSTEKTAIFKVLFNLDPSASLVQPSTEKTVWEIFHHFSGLDVRDKAPIYVGMRMGRPEKAKERKMSPPVQALFPLGHDTSANRSVKVAAKGRSVTVDVVTKQCPQCHHRTFQNLCPACKVRTNMIVVCSRCGQDLHQKEMCPKCNARGVHHGNQEVDLGTLIQDIQQGLNLKVPEIKGVKGMSSENKVPELLEKGMLRARNGVWVYKDGTIRYDSTNVPLTHFTPREVKTNIDKLHALGYTHDCYGQPLTSDDQICELMVQDILLPHHTAEYFLQVGHFVDEELQHIYNLPPFYNFKEKEDLIGVMFAGLAPHTSAAIIGRVIGFTKANSGYGHPFWHAAKRRNCDGDEDGLMLLLDTLLNFSKEFLPSKIGGKMDAPLVTSVILDPNEVDAEAQNVDTIWEYPESFYNFAQGFGAAPEFAKQMKLAGSRLKKPDQYEGFGFTHPTTSINAGPRVTNYKRLGTMEEKIEAQLKLARIILANDAKAIVTKILQSHFSPDIAGNMRAFATQEMRCSKCNEKYRRPPLTGKCAKCGSKLLMTVTKGGITKYLPIASRLAKEYNLSRFTQEKIELWEEYIKSLTDNGKVKQRTLMSFF